MSLNWTICNCHAKGKDITQALCKISVATATMSGSINFFGIDLLDKQLLVFSLLPHPRSVPADSDAEENQTQQTDEEDGEKVEATTAHILDNSSLTWVSVWAQVPADCDDVC